MRVHIRHAKVIDSQSDLNGKPVNIELEIHSKKDTRLKGGFNIAASKENKPSIIVDGKEVYNGKDIFISPGWIDVFADYREPGFEQKETITTGLAAAASGGFTDVLLAPNTNLPVTNKSAIQYLLQKAKGSIVNLHPHGAISQNIEGKEIAEMLDMRANGAIAFTDGWKPLQSADLMLKALEYVKAFDGTLLQIPVDTALSAGGLMHEGELSTVLGMTGIPALAETLILQRDIELLRYTGSKLHVCGVSTAASVALIRRAKAEGLRISCSVTPYHLALTDKALQGYSSLYKVSPPLRGEADRQALIAGLDDGTIDCITSHHRPHEWDAKAKEFEYAADGMAVQESTFNILWDTLKAKIGIEKLINALTINPRKIFGLHPNTINKENMAGITIFTTNDSYTLTENNKKSMGCNNPFFK